MSEHKFTAQTWADAIASMIKNAEEDGWAVGIGEDDDNERYILEVYTYDDWADRAEVEW